MQPLFSSRFNTLLLAAVLSASSVTFGATELTNLALKKTATASASEDANPPGDATDGDEGTRWCNADASTDCWWQVDLGATQKLGGCEILWEHDGAVYRYIVEGSADGKTWKPLNDQRGSKLDAQSQKLLLAGDDARYVRVRITGLDDGSWASFFECKLYSAADMKKLTADELRSFKAPAPEGVAGQMNNLAFKKAASASSTEDSHDAALANDGNDLTRWCAVDDQTPAWWMVDLAGAAATAPAAATTTASSNLVEIGEVDIRWEREGAYQFIIEGSADGKTWETLSDQKNNATALQAQPLKFAAKKERYVRITVTGLDAGNWASICEVKVLAPAK